MTYLTNEVDSGVCHSDTASRKLLHWLPFVLANCILHV